jgi:hypothetical protein
MSVPALMYGPLIATGEQRRHETRPGPACRLHLLVRQPLDPDGWLARRL